MTGYHTGGREIRLGRVQRRDLTLCADQPQRRSPGNPTMRALSGHGFVEGQRHVSERTKLPTCDYLFRITDEGRRYLQTGRDR